MARMVDLAVVRYDWVTTVAVPTAPTAAELNAGVALSVYLTTATSFGAEDSDVVSERGITETSQIDVPTIGKYQGMLEWFQDFTAGALAVTDLTTTFTGANEQGFLVRRIGLPASTAYAAAQKIEIAKFTADVPKRRAGEGTGFVKASVKLLQAGFYKAGVAVAT